MLRGSWPNPERILEQLILGVLGKVMQTALRVEVLVWRRPSLGGILGAFIGHNHGAFAGKACNVFARVGRNPRCILGRLL